MKWVYKDVRRIMGITQEAIRSTRDRILTPKGMSVAHNQWLFSEIGQLSFRNVISETNSRIFISFAKKTLNNLDITNIFCILLQQHPKVVELVDTPDLESGIRIRMCGFESRL